MRTVFAMALLLASSTAWAHAALVSVVPAKDSTVERSPAEVTLTFDEPVKVIASKVVDKEGTDVGGATFVDGATLHVAVRSNLANGKYTLTYRVTGGDDGHVVSGSTVFVVSAPH